MKIYKIYFTAKSSVATCMDYRHRLFISPTLYPDTQELVDHALELVSRKGVSFIVYRKIILNNVK